LRVFLTGGTGFIGTRLIRALAERGDHCVVLSRSAADRWDNPRVEVLKGDPTQPGEWQSRVGDADVVVNLAGKRLVEPPHRWTDARKRQLVQSRVDSTHQLAAAIRAAGNPPSALLSASAIGFYGDRASAMLDESAPPGDDFLAKLSLEWEEAAREVESVTRVALLRTGLVLDSNEGALAPLVPLFKLGLGGPWGSGEQWWSWIHIADEVGLIIFAIDHELAGPINLTAPNPVTVNRFAKSLGTALRRPALLRAPAFAMRLALGEMADALLGSQRVVPERALDAGYAFRFPDLATALADLFP